MKPTNQKPQQDWEKEQLSRWEEELNEMLNEASWGYEWDKEVAEYDIKQFISTHRIKLLNEVREMVEGMKKPLPLEEWEAKRFGVENYNQALNDLLTKLKDKQ